MKADLSRDTFNAHKHFSRVLSQQGRVQLDADANEQASILLHYIRTVVADLVGPHAAPVHGGGFDLVPGLSPNGDFGISQGRIYVDGILVENDLADVTYLTQSDLPDPPPLRSGRTYMTYLDVWERHISALEDPAIRETALGGPDTATRARVIWQVRTMEVPALQTLTSAQRTQLETELDTHRNTLASLRAALANATSQAQQLALRGQIATEQEEIDKIEATLTSAVPGGWCRAVEQFPRLSDAAMQARVEPVDPSPDPCIQAPDARYRGAANQLYRVEIHRGGLGQPPDITNVSSLTATFKWSRDNGSVATAVVNLQGDQLEVQNVRGFVPDGWVELSNDTLDLDDQPGALIEVVDITSDTMTIDTTTNTGDADLSQMTTVRRWDQQAMGDLDLVDGAVPLTEGAWIALEDGIQVWFNPGGTYRTGDYWLIPARAATGGIEWPTHAGPGGSVQPDALPPHGIMHHYSPLGIITYSGSAVSVTERCRCQFLPINDCARYGYDDDMGIGLDLLDI